MQRLSLFTFLLCLTACSKPLPELQGIDLAVWQQDKNACNGKRLLMEAAITTEKDKLKGLSEMDVVELLGKPDVHELYRRNQKFFYYYVTPGPDCADPEEQSRKLEIRFNAMGYAQLVSISNTGQ